MTQKILLIFLVSILLLSCEDINRTQVTKKPIEYKSAGFLFAYYPKDGMVKEFEAGYKEHLDWHKDNNDPLVWYAWNVVIGDELGLFIDGSFGSRFEDFDNRVNPAGDRANFTQTTAPFAVPHYRKVYELRADISAGKLLEEWNPSPSIQVYYYTLHPGTESRFERTLLNLKAALDGTENPTLMTWYKLIIGDDHPGYMLMIPRSGFKDFDSKGATLLEIGKNHLNSKESSALQAGLSKTVSSISSEMWRYRTDLSYLPNTNE